MRICMAAVILIILEQQTSVVFGVDHDMPIGEDILAAEPKEKSTFDQLMARREHFFRTLRRQKQRKTNKQINEKARERTAEGRVLLSNERGIERSSIIVMPINKPKVLTSEIYGSERSRRVHGETQREDESNTDNEMKRSNDNELSEAQKQSANLQFAIDKERTNANARHQSDPKRQDTVAIFPAEYWQLPPALLAARLRRFSKATIMRSLRQNAQRMGVDGSKLRAVMRQIDLMRREEAQLRSHRHYLPLGKKNYVPSVSFLVDDDSFHRSVDVIDSEKAPPSKIHAQFQKHGSTELMAEEETDLDLLHPSASVGGSEFESYRKLYMKSKAYNRYEQPQQRLLPSQVHATTAQKLLTNATKAVNFVPPNARHITQQRQRITQIQTAATVGPSLPTVSPLLLTPNAKLELCCRKQQLPSTCQQFCNFDTFTQEKLLIALLGSHCPSAQLSKAFDCATSKVDHSECCRQAGIDRIHNGQCMVFCRTHIKTPPNVSGYVSCLSVFGTIKNCYRDHQIKHKNLFGD